MSDARVLPFLRRKRKFPAADRTMRAPLVWGGGGAPVEIVAPDEYCTRLLLEYAAPFFPAELLAGAGWVVSVQPPATGGAWVLELLSLIERWLESIPLPCTKVRYDGQTYLIRASSHISHFAAAAELASAPAA